MELNLGNMGAARQSWSRDSVRVIYMELKTEHPKADHSQLVKLMAERSIQDDEMRIAAFDYIVTACENAQWGYKKRAVGSPRGSAPQVRDAVLQEVKATAESIINQILLLNLEMPNGKRLRYCTREEVAKFGKAYARMAKKMKPRQLVGQAFSENEVRAFLK